MDSDNASSDKVEYIQDSSVFKNVEDKPTPPTSPSPVPSVTGSTDAQNSNPHESNKILGHNYNGTGL